MAATDRLRSLYQEMADLTAGRCAKVCTSKSGFRCCSVGDCAITELYAREQGVVLVPTLCEFHRPYKPPFMRADGSCSVPPHLRPFCTLHDCDISSLGFAKNDPDLEYTRRYFALRDEISDEEDKSRGGDSWPTP